MARSEPANSCAKEKQNLTSVNTHKGKVKAKLMRDIKNGIEPDGFSCGGQVKEDHFDHLWISKCDLGDVSKVGRKDLACFAAWRLLGGSNQPQGGVVGAQTCWQILQESE